MKDVLLFLQDLAANNNKPWFDENRKRYDAIRAQFMALVAASIQEMGKRVKLPALEPKDCVFRINRDIRFAKDKTPYKNNMSFVVSPQGKKGEVINGVYVHIQPGQSFIAMGLYEPSPEELKKVRQEIDFNLDRWKMILDDSAFKMNFGTVGGTILKTAPKGYDSTNPAIEWLRHTQFIVMHKLDDKQVANAKFPEVVAQIFEDAAPFREFLQDALA